MIPVTMHVAPLFSDVPWVYVGITAARRLTIEHAWNYPLVCGMFFFGFCAVYESQGPLKGWWAWPRADNVVKLGCAVWQAGKLGEDGRGLVASPHVVEALEERVFGVPVMAPLYHFGLGSGVALAFQACGFRRPLLAVSLHHTVCTGARRTCQSDGYICAGFHRPRSRLAMGPHDALDLLRFRCIQTGIGHEPHPARKLLGRDRRASDALPAVT